jgi:hypothetical protein
LLPVSGEGQGRHRGLMSLEATGQFT